MSTHIYRVSEIMPRLPQQWTVSRLWNYSPPSTFMFYCFKTQNLQSLRLQSKLNGAGYVTHKSPYSLKRKSRVGLVIKDEKMHRASHNGMCEDRVCKLWATGLFSWDVKHRAYRLCCPRWFTNNLWCMVEWKWLLKKLWQMTITIHIQMKRDVFS